MAQLATREIFNALFKARYFRENSRIHGQSELYQNKIKKMKPGTLNKVRSW